MAVSVSSSIIPGIKLNSILNLKSRDNLHGNYGARSLEGLQAADTCCSQWQIRPVNAICWRFFIWVFHWNEWGTGRRQEKAVCTTAQCVLAAADLLQAMDPTADPCQDFFEFACGGWIKKHPIPDSKSRWTQFDILRDELTAFLRGKSASCSICLWWDDGRNISRNLDVLKRLNRCARRLLGNKCMWRECVSLMRTRAIQWFIHSFRIKALTQLCQ